ncbi:AraC family transcriptional regulator [Reyranella sp.]|jgi:AraC-like DNA-binding protein|uniref:AraC family transcriptional regulator n=1 Tax=Reyranella sp. TaxID=1929291 RepID=UPI002F924130
MRVLMIEARWAIHIVEDVRRAGLASDGLLKQVGLKQEELDDPENRIPYAAYVGLIERAAVLLDRPDYGLRLGAAHDIRDNGLIGFIALNSPTLKDALANVERYVSVTNEGIDAVLEHDPEGLALRFREADAALRGLRHNSEHAAAHITTGARELTRKRATPVRVEFMHGRPNVNIDYEGAFGCPVRFDARWDGVVFSDETAALTVVGADNRLLRVLESACRKIIGPAARKHDFIHSVREHLVKRLAKGAAPFEDVARHFAMSTKTLERRLGEHGTSYRRLRDDIRCELAKHYLGRTDLRLQQIAYLLGYSEPGPLVRAFKRWTGNTPIQYREASR